MRQLISLPFKKVFVRKRFICQESLPDGMIEAYLVAVCTVLNEAPKLMVMTHEGAMFCYVPPHAIAFDESAPDLFIDESCRWDCLADSGEIVELEFMKAVDVNWLHNGSRKSGEYMFSLHFNERSHWCTMPEQSKIFHFVKGIDGNLYIVVNNQCRWEHSAIVDLSSPMQLIPEPNSQIWYCESGQFTKNQNKCSMKNVQVETAQNIE